MSIESNQPQSTNNIIRRSERQWSHKDEWKLRGSTFCVVVSRHHGRPLDHTEGENRWAVYCYIYSKHPLFNTFEKNKLWQDSTNRLPLHAGCSFLKHHYDDNGIITSVQVGADYHHLHDSYFTHMKTKEDASEVFYDAQQLFDCLESINSQTDTNDASAVSTSNTQNP